MRERGISYAEAKVLVEWLAETEVWVNSLYQVHIVRTATNGFGVPMVWLSIKRHDKLPIHDWRDLQRIKNELLGPEIEAIELYPAESRVVDTANQFHLWAFPQGVAVPLGWTDRLVQGEGRIGSFGCVGQRAIAS
jgi:hypothetical protein